MATQQNPTLRRPLSADAGAVGGAPTAPGGTPAAANPVSAAINRATAPTIVRPGQAAPDANPLPLGTRAGTALRQGYRNAVNFGVDRTNDLTHAGTAVANFATSGPRAVAGFVRDTARALVGAPASPNAGKPVAPLSAPTLERPFTPAPVVFQTDAPAQGSKDAVARDPNYDPSADNISAHNLAVARGQGAVTGGADRVTASVAQGAAPALTRPGVDSGTVVDGHRLNFGAMVNGIPTFSDGSGNAGIPRTVSDDTIKSAASRLNTASAPVAPLASDVLGHTPSTDEMVAQRMATLTRPITGSRPSAADFAASERNAIASGDWRSAAGTAASNLRMDAQYGGTSKLRRLAGDQLLGLQAGSDQAAALAQQGEQQQSAIDARGRNALDVADLQGQYGLAEAETQLQRPRAGNQVTLADGTIGLQDPISGAITTSIGPDGRPAKALQTRDDSATKRTQEIQDQLARTAAELVKNWTPPAGAAADSPPPYEQFREQAARLAGLSIVKNKAGEKLVNINGQWMPL